MDTNLQVLLSIDNLVIQIIDERSIVVELILLIYLPFNHRLCEYYNTCDFTLDHIQ